MRTSARRVVPVAVFVLVGLGLAVQRGGAEERWYGGVYSLAIPADPGASSGWMEEAIIEVPDHLIIEDLNVRMSVTHTNVSDLRLSLTSPSGTTVLLSEFDPLDGFVEGADYRETLFDDESPISIADGAPPFDPIRKLLRPGPTHPHPPLPR